MEEDAPRTYEAMGIGRESLEEISRLLAGDTGWYSDAQIRKLLPQMGGKSITHSELMQMYGDMKGLDPEVIECTSTEFALFAQRVANIINSPEEDR